MASVKRQRSGEEMLRMVHLFKRSYGLKPLERVSKDEFGVPR